MRPSSFRALTFSGDTLLRSSSFSAGNESAEKYAKLDFNVGWAGSVKFQTCSEICPVVLPCVLVTVKLPLYTPDAAVRGTNTSTQIGWFAFPPTLNGTAFRLPPTGGSPVEGSTNGMRPSGYQPAPNGWLEPPQFGLEEVT